MAKPFDFSTALMISREPSLSPKAKARKDQEALDLRRRELLSEKQTMDARKLEQFQNEQRRRGYQAIDKMEFPKANPIEYHTNQDVHPELTQAPLQGPTENAMGGPETPTPRWAQAPAIEDEQPAQPTPRWAQAPAIDEPKQQAEPLNRSELDAGIEEAAASIPGGYAAWKKQPANPERMKELGYVRDPLAPAGYAKPSGPDPFTTMGNSPEKPWNESVADILQAGADFLLAPLEARNTGGDDPLGAVAKGMARGTADAPAMAFRDPAQFVETYDPAHQLLRGYNSAVDLGGDLIEGDTSNVIPKASSAISDTLGGIMGVTGLGGVVKPKPGTAAAAKQAPVRQPSIRETGKTLASAVLPTSAIRPQAYDAIERILVNSGVPGDRVRLGLAKIVESLKTGADGNAVGSPGRQTIAQLLEREYGKEFPEVIENLRTVLLERRLSRKAGDRSPTTVRETVQDMRATQVPHLQESLNKNLGDATRTGTREQVAENLRQIGEEGYKPITSQQATPERAQAIQAVLNGPGMNELGRPLRQIAAGEGIDIEQMIAQRPIEAAHWMQHKARLLAEENGDTALGNAYGKMRDRILNTIDDLTAPDGKTYAQIRKEYGDEAGIKGALTAGDRFGAIVRNPDGANQFIAKFNEATPEQQAAQLASIRDWAESKLRGGGEEGAARMTELQNIAVLDTLDRLGPQGKALADDIRGIRDEEQFLGGFYPKSESATASNTIAREQGPDIYSRAAKSSIGMSTAADGILMGAGATHAPLVTALRQGPKLYRGIMQPKTATREDMTRLLMARPGAKAPGVKIDTPPPPPSRSIPPGGGRSVAAPERAMPVEQIDTTGWGPGEFQAARNQLNEMLQDLNKAPAADRAGMEAEIASLKQALGLGEIPPEFRDVSMGGRFKAPVEMPWAAGSAEDAAIKQAIAKKQWTVEAVPAEQITPTQDSVFYDYAKAAQRYAGDDAMPVLVKQGDQYFVADGHHRLMPQNDGPVRARVIDLDASTPKPPTQAGSKLPMDEASRMGGEAPRSRLPTAADFQRSWVKATNEQGSANVADPEMGFKNYPDLTSDIVDVAEQRVKALISGDIEIKTNTSVSNVSPSAYIEVDLVREGEILDTLKIRVSDHADRYGSDATVRVDGRADELMDEGEFDGLAIPLSRLQSMVDEVVSETIEAAYRKGYNLRRPSQSGSSKLLAGVVGTAGLGSVLASEILDDEARKRRQN